ncbi:MAG: hypothetical protein K8R02_07890 [Anaerohalosphaeraceae bacterium]|nr:hypothetical protein [Anaerohalosphaeraceae bacterium]
MSVHWDKVADQYVIRFRDANNRHRNVTVNAKNLDKYGLTIPKRITERVAKRLEVEILRQETLSNGLIRGIERQGLLYWDIVPQAGNAEKLHNIIVKSNIPNIWKPKRNNYIMVESMPTLGSGKLDIMKLRQIALSAKQSGE